MMFDRALFHDISIDTLYAGLILLFFVIVERALTYAYLSLKARRIARDIASNPNGAEIGRAHV